MWSAELRVLLERHPRASWPAQGSATVQLWLEVHDGFRRECVALSRAGDDCREGRLSARELAVVAAPRLRGMVARLHGHHEIEDHHYFPTLAGAERHLARDFDLLTADHALLQEEIGRALAALDGLVAAADAPAAEAPAVGHAVDRYVRDSDRLCRRLVRHLSDEEDLVIPLLLERGA